MMQTVVAQDGADGANTLIDVSSGIRGNGVGYRFGGPIGGDIDIPQRFGYLRLCDVPFGWIL